jgi:hypothetical protein
MLCFDIPLLASSHHFNGAPVSSDRRRVGDQVQPNLLRAGPYCFAPSQSGIFGDCVTIVPGLLSVESGHLTGIELVTGLRAFKSLPLTDRSRQ